MILYTHDNKEYQAHFCVEDSSVEGRPPLLGIVCDQKFPSGDRDYGEHMLGLEQAETLWRVIRRWCEDKRVAAVEAERDAEGKSRL